MPSRSLDKTRMLQKELSVKRSDLRSWLTKESSQRSAGGTRRRGGTVMGFSLRAGHFAEESDDEYDDTENLDAIVEDCNNSHREMLFKQASRRSDMSNIGKVDIDLFSDEFRSDSINRRMTIDTANISDGQQSNGDAASTKSHAVRGKLKRFFSRKKSRRASLW
ncbi:predicted protein [Chaetoceros tenuissimus]|uniref:Uncharacterized protein n=1 Tax=Chaetoceros tenuissimus TaxID=426638 RepID=A0AAD3CDW8_9STRA|nr:predicted protein [Chaetoceros tenuissimus]